MPVRSLLVSPGWDGAEVRVEWSHVELGCDWRALRWRVLEVAALAPVDGVVVTLRARRWEPPPLHVGYGVPAPLRWVLPSAWDGGVWVSVAGLGDGAPVSGALPVRLLVEASQRP